MDAIRTIESELGVSLPEFFYWPQEVKFYEAELRQETSSFEMLYQKDTSLVYFEGWYNTEDASAINSWEGEGDISYKQYGDIKYKIVDIKTDDAESQDYYYVEWNVNNARFLLAGLDNMVEIENILKNVKN